MRTIVAKPELRVKVACRIPLHRRRGIGRFKNQVYTACEDIGEPGNRSPNMWRYLRLVRIVTVIEVLRTRITTTATIITIIVVIDPPFRPGKGFPGLLQAGRGVSGTQTTGHEPHPFPNRKASHSIVGFAGDSSHFKQGLFQAGQRG